MSRLLIFNGPPRSGKTTAAGYVVSQIGKWSTLRAQQLDLAAPLKSATRSLFGAECGDWEGELKDQPHPTWLGMSYREALITVSERMVKPALGKDFFGRIAARTMAQNMDTDVWVVGDGGFAEECRPLIDSVGRENTLLLELHGTKDVVVSFEGDSRSYIGESLGVEFVRVPCHELALVWSIVKKWLGIEDGSDT